MSTGKEQKKDKYLEAVDKINDLHEASRKKEDDSIIIEISRQETAKLLGQTVAKDASMENLAKRINNQNSLGFAAQVEGDKIVVYTQPVYVSFDEACENLRKEESEEDDFES